MWLMNDGDGLPLTQYHTIVCAQSTRSLAKLTDTTHKMTDLVITFSPGYLMANNLPRGGALWQVESATRHGNANTVGMSRQESAEVKVGILWYTLPEPLRFFVSGSLATAALFLLEKVMRGLLAQTSLHRSSSKHIGTISYFLAYLLHIAVQHALHALLVYGLQSINTRQKYASTLLGTYQALLVSCCGSTILNTYLVNIGLDRDVAFASTLVVFSGVNYLWIQSIYHAKDCVVVENAHKATETARNQKSIGPKRGKRVITRGGDTMGSWGAWSNYKEAVSSAPAP